MDTPINETTCVHCNAALTPSDLSTGWCDSCGKRLPSVPRAAKKPAAASAAPAAGGKGTSWAIWSAAALAIVAVGASVFAFAR